MVDDEQKKIFDIDFDAPSDGKSDGLEELELDDLGARFIKNPKVGEEIVIDIAKIYRDKNVRAKTKEGRAFSTALSGTDFKFTLEDKAGKKYSPPAWEVWKKVRDIMLEKKTKNVKVSIKHIRDGNKHKDGQENYQVAFVEEKK